MALKERVRRGAGDRLTLVLVLGAAVFSFSAIDWLKAHLGDHFLKFILLGLGILTLALVAFTISRLKASGIKPPSWRELRNQGSAPEEASSSGQVESETEKKKGGPEAAP
jgi:hypothetical protein